MSPEHAEGGIRRILLALDAATHSREALRSVAELASRLRAEVTGLFVEDEDLLRSAALPCARQVTLPTGASSRFESEDVERELRSMASQARQDLARAAERAQVRWSFRVVRGQVAAEVTAAAADADLVMVEGTGRPLTRHVRLTTRARDAAGRAQGAVLYHRPGAWLYRPAVTYFDGAARSLRALRIAARLAEGGTGQLDVLTSPSAGRTSDTLEAMVSEGTARRRIRIRFFQIAAPTVQGLCQATRALAGGVLVLGSPLAEGQEARLLADLDCPVMVIR